MKRHLPSALTLLMAFLVAGHTQTEETYTGHIILGTPTDRSIAVKVMFAEAQDSAFVEYGAKSGSYAASTPVQQGIAAGVPYDTVLINLNADARYFYRVRSRKSAGASYAASLEYSFHTQRARGRAFTFCIQGDSHPERASQFDASLYARTLQTASNDRPDFYMTIGDDFSVDTLKTVNAATVAERYTLQLPYLGLIAPSAPLFLVNGNHEQAARYLLDGTPNNVAVWAQNARNLYYPQPAPDGFYTGNAEVVPNIGLLRNYYAWEWGDALFVTIDPYWSSPVAVDNVFGGDSKTTSRWEITHGDAQYQWLKQTLEGSKAKWKFVFAHHVIGTGRGGVEVAPYFEWGGRNQNGSDGFSANRPKWPMPIHQLMAANNVTIFFQGHDHLFVRQQLDGVTYQELPEPADPTYTLWNSDAYQSGDKFSNTGYVRVNVTSSVVRVEYVRTFLPKDEKPPSQVNGMVQFAYAIQDAASGSQVDFSVPAGGAAAMRTMGNGTSLQSGYAAVSASSGPTPYGTAVFSFARDGAVVSETGVPASPPTTAARVFIDQANRVPAGPPHLKALPVDIFTGVAVVNPGTTDAILTLTLRSLSGITLGSGRGRLAAGTHQARFLHQLQDLAPDFVLPAEFSSTFRFGTLDIESDRPVSVAALRMTVNQRAEPLFTTIPIADLALASSSSPLLFPHVVDGDGYLSSFILMNPASQTQSGTLRFFADSGDPMIVRSSAGDAGSVFSYSIQANGAAVLETDGSSPSLRSGSVQLSPDPGSFTPVAAGLFSRTTSGALITESGIPSAVPGSHVRVYVDMLDGHDSGVAIAATGAGAVVSLSAYSSDASSTVGQRPAPLSLASNGHAAAFVRQWVAGIPAGFRGVLDISSPSSFAALTLRALTNVRGDFLITTFPVADFGRDAPSPVVFPHLADGAGYFTEFLLLGGSGATEASLKLLGESGAPLAVGPGNGLFTVSSPVVDEGGLLPARFTCDGTADTLPLSWRNEPAGTQSYVVTMHTAAPDAVHWYWLLWDIPASVHNLPENTAGIGTLGSNSVNSRGGYTPPCSQGPGLKTYTYTVYALSAAPQINAPAILVTRDALLNAIAARTLGSATLDVTYARP
jgi:phosphatidylethanolamine-binding protein (PEBP) family uncharacterized protein